MKKLLPILVVIVLLGGGYFLYNKNKEVEKKMMETEIMETDEEMEEAKDLESFTGTLKTLVAKNIPMICSYDIQGYKYNAWIKGDMVKSEFSNPQGMGTAIVKNNCMYTWMEGETQGMKVCFDPAEQEEVWDTSQNLSSEYHCVPSIIMDSVFDLPDDVEFLGLDMMMQMEGLEDYMQQ